MLLCSGVYFMSYLTRINYAASLTEIIPALGVTKQAASAAVTGAFVTYGLGQFFSGMLGDRISPRKMLSIGLLGTAFCNLGVTLPMPITGITVIWCFNGMFQAMLWPPLMRAMLERLDTQSYRTTTAAVSVAAQAASITVYLLVPACIRLSGWHLSFYAAAVLAIGMAVTWWFAYPRFPIREADDGKPAARERTRGSFREVTAGSGLVLIAIGIVLQGTLRDGVLTWMPTYLNEQFDLGSIASILTTVLLPIFSAVSIYLASVLVKKIPNEITCTVICFAPAMLAMIVLTLLPSSAVGTTAVCLMLTSGCMHGVNLMLTSQVVLRYKASGKVSSIGGFLNAFTYVGSALSTYGVAVISERWGWNGALWTWLAAGVLGVGIMAAELPRWCRFAGLSLSGRDR